MTNVNNFGYNPNIAATAVPQQAAPSYAPVSLAAPTQQAYAPVVSTSPAPAPAPYYSAPQNTMAVPSTNGVNIVIYNPMVNPNGANINNSYAAPAGQAYPQNYYLNQPAAALAATAPSTAASTLYSEKISETTKKEEKEPAKKQIVQLTDEYIQTLENYLKNPSNDIKLMGAKELRERFREEESRKNDAALTSLLNLTLQSKSSPVKIVGMDIIDQGWASGDDLTKYLLAQIQGSKSGLGMDALDAAKASLKSAGKTITVPDTNPDYAKKTKKKSE